MNDSLRHGNLVEMLKTFTKNEMKEFDKFVRSPFHNNRNEVTRLWTELKKYHPSFDQKNFTKEKIFGRVYPHQKLREDVMSRLGSNLISVLENYLSYKQFSENAFDRKLSLLDSLYKRNLDKILNKEFKRAEEILENNDGIDIWYLLNKYRLNILKNDHYITTGDIKLLINNSEGIENLICFFLTGLFTALINFKINERDFNANYDSWLHTAFINSFDAVKIFDKIKNNGSEGRILTLAHFYAYLAIENYKDEESLLKLKDLLNNYYNKFSRRTTINLYVGLLNICLHKRRGGDISYLRKSFDIYKEIVSKNLLTETESDYIDKNHFINIVSLALKINEIDWAESFVESNIDRASPEEKTNIYNYCNATFAYYRKDFNTALNLIMKVNLPYYKYMAINLLCKIYYDMDYTEQLFFLIDSYRHYVNNDKKVPKDINAKDLSFLLYLNKLVKIKFNNDYNALSRLKKNIAESPYGGKEWLLEKIEELEKQK